MGENSSLFYTVNKTSFNKNKLNLDMIDKGNLNVLLMCFFLDLDENYGLHGCMNRKVRILCHSSCSILVLLMLS